MRDLRRPGPLLAAARVPYDPAMATWRRILVPTDLSAASTRGVVRAAELARAGGAKTLLVCVVEKTWFAPLPMGVQAPATFLGEGDALGEVVAHTQERLQELRATHFAGLEAETKVVVAAGSAAGILDAAESWHADLIVVASHGRSGVAHLLLGSTAEKVLRHAPCEVLVVRAKA
jgi:universal stress protein A